MYFNLHTPHVTRKSWRKARPQANRQQLPLQPRGGGAVPPPPGAPQRGRQPRGQPAGTPRALPSLRRASLPGTGAVSTPPCLLTGSPGLAAAGHGAGGAAPRAPLGRRSPGCSSGAEGKMQPPPPARPRGPRARPAAAGSRPKRPCSSLGPWPSRGAPSPPHEQRVPCLDAREAGRPRGQPAGREGGDLTMGAARLMGHLEGLDGWI